MEKDRQIQLYLALLAESGSTSVNTTFPLIPLPHLFRLFSFRQNGRSTSTRCNFRHSSYKTRDTTEHQIQGRHDVSVQNRLLPPINHSIFPAKKSVLSLDEADENNSGHFVQEPVYHYCAATALRNPYLPAYRQYCQQGWLQIRAKTKMSAHNFGKFYRSGKMNDL